MGSLKTLALATATVAALAPFGARAADLPAMIPPPPIEDYGGWYLRGDIGMTNQRVGRLDNMLFATTEGLNIIDKNFESGILWGLGIGYKYSSWLRLDLTGEYRGETGFHGLDEYLFNDVDDPINDPPNIVTRTNIYTAKKSEWLFLANAYLDLGTWQRVTPFIGAGIGTAKVTIHSFKDVDPTSGDFYSASVAYAKADSKWNFAWALHAGLAYDVSPNFTIELAYRYLHLGNGKSGDIIPVGCDPSDSGCNPNNNPMHFKGISSHDVKLGVRWMFADSGYPAYHPPIVSKY